MKIVSVFVHSWEGLWVRNYRKREALGGGLDINYKRGGGERKTKIPKKKLLYFVFSLDSQSLWDKSGSRYMFLI